MLSATSFQITCTVLSTDGQVVTVTTAVGNAKDADYFAGGWIANSQLAPRNWKAMNGRVEAF